MAKYHYINAKGDKSIIPSATFVDALCNADPLNVLDFEIIFEKCEQLIKTEFQPSREALSNVRGRWYEWMISVGFLNFRKKNPHFRKNIFVPVPNVDSLDIYSLYEDSVYSFIRDLRQKTEKSGVSLISSNPDFLICVDKGVCFPDISSVDEKCLQEIDSMYKSCVGNLSFSDLLGFCSVKTSLRPDRRLQLSHEGALTKAFYEHLKGRLWEINAPGLKYYASSMKVGEKDRRGVSTVATHSILSVNSTPESAVDELFEIKSGPQLEQFFKKILA